MHSNKTVVAGMLEILYFIYLFILLLSVPFLRLIFDVEISAEFSTYYIGICFAPFAHSERQNMMHIFFGGGRMGIASGVCFFIYLLYFIIFHFIFILYHLLF